MSTEITVNTPLELAATLRDISFVNTVLDFKWRFEFKEELISNKSAWLLWVSFERPDTLTGVVSRGRGRDEIIYAGATVSAVVKTAWVLVELMIRHELMEGFRWKNKRIFNPHNTVEALASIQYD